MNKKIHGVSDIRTSQKAKILSKPKSGAQQYLDLYLRVKEKERLLNYSSVIDKSMKQTRDKVEDLDREITELKKSMTIKNEEPFSQGKSKKPILRTPLKSIILDY